MTFATNPFLRIDVHAPALVAARERQYEIERHVKALKAVLDYEVRITLFAEMRHCCTCSGQKLRFLRGAAEVVR
jgi:hypothetical protein